MIETAAQTQQISHGEIAKVYARIDKSCAMSKVDIITRTLDRPIMLRRAIEDVLSQSYENWNHIIVNDGGNPEIINSLVEEYKDKYGDRVILVHNDETKGMEAASNIGIKKGDGSYIVIHDDDDTWARDFLRITVEKLDSLKEELYAGVVTWSKVVHEIIIDNNIIIKDEHPFNNWMNHITLWRMLKENRFPPISFLFRRSVWEELGGFNEDLPVLGDWDFHIKCLEKYRIYLITEILANYHHRVEEDGIYGNTVIAQKKRHEYFRDMLIDDWLREGISSNVLSRGQLVKLSEMFENAERTRYIADIVLDKLQEYDEKFRNLEEKINKSRLVKILAKWL